AENELRLSAWQRPPVATLPPWVPSMKARCSARGRVRVFCVWAHSSIRASRKALAHQGCFESVKAAPSVDERDAHGTLERTFTNTGHVRSRSWSLLTNVTSHP